MGMGDVCLQMGVTLVTCERFCQWSVITQLVLHSKNTARSNNAGVFFENLVAPFPDKDLSRETHHVPSCNTVRPLPAQEHEKQFSKTDNGCTSHSSGFGAPRASRSSKTEQEKETSQPSLQGADGRQTNTRESCAICPRAPFGIAT